MQSLGVIVARGGSKRFPRKMLSKLAGAPLISYMGRAAAKSRLDRTVLSTDDSEIAQLGLDCGIDVPFRRPAELATDFVTNDRVLMHAIDWIEQNERRRYDVVVLLQPTAPFTTAGDIDGCLEALRTTSANCCFAATSVTEQPHWMFVPQDNGEVDLMIPGLLSGDRQHTQKLPRYVLPAGGVWAVRITALREHGRIYSAPLRTVVVEPHRAVDIDTEFDLVVAEAVAKHYGALVLERAD